MSTPAVWGGPSAGTTPPKSTSIAKSSDTQGSTYAPGLQSPATVCPVLCATGPAPGRRSRTQSQPPCLPQRPGLRSSCVSVSPVAKQGGSRSPCLPHGAILRIHGKALCPSEEEDSEAKAICDGARVQRSARGAGSQAEAVPSDQGFSAHWATRCNLGLKGQATHHHWARPRPGGVPPAPHCSRALPLGPCVLRACQPAS